MKKICFFILLVIVIYANAQKASEMKVTSTTRLIKSNNCEKTIIKSPVNNNTFLQ